MKAAALRGSKRMDVVELADVEPAAGEVTLRVAYCGICGSDMHEYESENPMRVLGVMQPVMGHEFSGTILAVGDGVTSVRVGQVATGNPGAGCGACAYCDAGRENLCRAGSMGGVGYTRAGAYAEYVVMPERSVVVLPERSDLQSCALTEPFAVARHALIQGRYRPEELLVVVGAGAIGVLSGVGGRERG